MAKIEILKPLLNLFMIIQFFSNFKYKSVKNRRSLSGNFGIHLVMLRFPGRIVIFRKNRISAEREGPRTIKKAEYTVLGSCNKS